MSVTGVVLAAGESSRLGRPKQLLVHRGKPLVRLVVEEALASICDGVIVVLGAHEAAIRPALEGIAATIVVNSRWSEGMASSIRCGIEATSPRSSTGALLMLCDQPALDVAHLNALAQAHDLHGGIVASRYADALGVPAVFDRRAFPALLALEGTEGAKKVLRRAENVTAIDWPAGEHDIDTESDAARLTLPSPGRPNT